ncbi:hypothetical protein [Jannaschia sp. R86511]|uniref:hypothetical protein n=1 Tax=Jannaschia sp. R86511 TaxID=3093853 RepID=UPI0036D3BBC2
MTRPALVDARRPVSRPPRWRRWNLLGLTALTAYSTAIAWQAQLVSYPLYRAVDPASFAAYHQQYNEAIPVVVIAPGFASFLAGAAFWWTRPADIPRPAAALVGVAGVTALLSTVLWAIPMHVRLDDIGQSAATIDSLLDANLLRTAALSTATVALLWCQVRAGRQD